MLESHISVMGAVSQFRINTSYSVLDATNARYAIIAGTLNATFKGYFYQKMREYDTCAGQFCNLQTESKSHQNRDDLVDKPASG